MPPLPLNHITTHEDNRSFQQHAHSPLVEALGAVARCIPTLGSLVLLSSCVLGTTARDRIYPPIELTFNVSSKWFRAPAEGATIKIDRYYPALVLGTYVPVVEGKTDSQGQFRTAIHLSGRYSIYVAYEGHDGFLEYIDSLSESRTFDLSLNRVVSSDSAFPRQEHPMSYNFCSAGVGEIL